MSNFTDSYALKLIDQITAPMRKIEAQAMKLNETLEKIQGIAQGGAGLVKLVAMAGAGMLAFRGLSFAIGGVISMLEKGAGVAAAFGKAVISATSFREKYLTMFANNFGETRAKQLYGRVLDISQITPGLAGDMMDNVARLSNVGFTGRGLSKVNAAAADIQAMFGDEKAAMFTRGMSDMFSKSKFEEQDFKQAVAGIIPASLAQAAILRMKGISVAADKVSATFEKLKKAGKITGKEGAAGVLAALNQHIDKGQGLGSFSLKRAGGVEGLLSNLEEAPANFLRRMDLEGLPGLKVLKDFLGKLLKFFDLATPQGKQLAVVVEKMTNALFGGLGRISEQDLANWFKSGVAVAEQFVRLVEKAWRVLNEILHGSWSSVLGAAAGVVMQLGVVLGSAIWQGMRASIAGSSPVLAKMMGFDQAAMKDLKTEEGTLKARLAANPGDVVAANRLAEVQRQMRGLDTSHTHLPGRRDGTLHDDLGNAKSAAWTAAKDAGARALSSVGSTFGGIGGMFGAAWSSATGSVGNIFSPPQARQNMSKVGEDMSAGMEQGARDRGQTHSPSVVMAEVGEDMVDGLLEGLARRAQQLRTGGAAVDPALDTLLELLRGVALRQGAAHR